MSIFRLNKNSSAGTAPSVVVHSPSQNSTSGDHRDQHIDLLAVRSPRASQFRIHREGSKTQILSLARNTGAEPDQQRKRRASSQTYQQGSSTLQVPQHNLSPASDATSTPTATQDSTHPLQHVTITPAIPGAHDVAPPDIAPPDILTKSAEQVLHSPSALPASSPVNVTGCSQECSHEHAVPHLHLEAAPPEARFTIDAFRSCARYSDLEPDHLELLDDFKDHAALHSADAPITIYKSFTGAKALSKLLDRRHGGHWSWHEASLFYRFATKSRHLGYALLDMNRRERNLIKNEIFTEDVLRRARIYREVCVTGDTKQFKASMEGTSESVCNARKGRLRTQKERLKPLHSTRGHSPSLCCCFARMSPPSSRSLSSPATTRAAPRDGEATSIFVVIGWFPGEISEPHETCVIVEDPGHFLPDLKKHIAGLRGWRTMLSFKSVQGFGLYECCPERLSHVSHYTSEVDDLTLAQFFRATNKSYRRAYWRINEPDDKTNPSFLKRRDSQAWAEWVHRNINNNRSSPFRSTLALKLVLGWSQARIAIAASVPLLLSFAIGMYMMSTGRDISDAWTAASYIVTAGAFIVALMAVLSALKDGTTTPQTKPRVSDGYGV